MNDLETVLLILFVYSQGIAVGYIVWAPETPFKKGFVDGLCLKSLWNWLKLRK